MQLNEELGEVICPECNGKGYCPPYIDDISICQSVCQRCQGNGKLDWIEQATGVAPPKYEKINIKASTRSLKANWTMEVEQDLKYLYDPDILTELQRQFAEETAIQIDKKLIEAISNPLEQIKKKHFPEWEGINDN